MIFKWFMLNNVAETIIFVFYKKGSLSEEINLINNDYGFFKWLLVFAK